ncbi:hypothetical protein [Sphingomonas sp. GB1N7]|uniref:hypothetical protein n=1 Tax=Parasphingomonas caseinilytica TaxID=3096158 RepID=UPI002FC5D0B8
MSAIVSSLIGGVIAVGFTALAARTHGKGQLTPDGWKRLRAGWLLKGTIFGSASLVAVMAYLLLSGGSTRPDAAEQNGYVAILVVGFGAIACYTFWSAYGRVIAWRGNELRVRSLTGREFSQKISDITGIIKSEMRGEYRLSFQDGSRLWLSAYLHGAEELVATLPLSTDDC